MFCSDFQRTECLCWSTGQIPGFPPPSSSAWPSLSGGWLRDTPTTAGFCKTYLVRVLFSLALPSSVPSLLRLCVSRPHLETDALLAHLGGCRGNGVPVFLRHLYGLHHSVHHRGQSHTPWSHPPVRYAYSTQDHQSVMVKAATGGGGSKNIEPIPIVFVVPKLLPSALDKACPATLTGSLPYSLLGYGDVGVPGLLVALSLQFDTSWRPACKFWPYFTVASVGKFSFNFLQIFDAPSPPSLLCGAWLHIRCPVPH